LGNSFWKIDDKRTVVLKPSDVIFISNTVSHEVWGEGPRFGVLLFAVEETKKIK
jgi:hypothetical protein